MKKTFSLIIFMLCSCSICGCFATFDGARVRNGARAIASMAVIQESEGSKNYPMVVFGVRSGHVNKKDSTLNIEWGGLLELFPGKGPVYFSLDEGGNSDEEEKGTRCQLNLDIKHQWIMNTVLDSSLRLRCCFPFFTYPDLSLVLGKNIKGNDIYLEAGQNSSDFNSLYQYGLNGLTVVKAGARVPLTEQTAFVVESGRSWGYIYAGLGLEF